MTLDIVVIGCGGHGREVFDTIRAVNAAGPAGPVWRCRGFVDDGPTEANLKRIHALGAAYLGPLAELADLPARTHLAVAIGDPRARRAVVERIERYRLPVADLVHPAATVGPDTAYGEGLIAFAGARVTTNVALGRHVHLNQNSAVAHDCVVGDYVSVSPLAAVTGACRLGDRVLVGAGAAILPGVTIGSDATVGGGACVVRDVPSGAVVKGVPAR